MEVHSLADLVLWSCILHTVCEAQKNEFLLHWVDQQFNQQVHVPKGWSIDVDVDIANAEDIREALAAYFVSSGGLASAGVNIVNVLKNMHACYYIFNFIFTK